ncbi:hypothetical protein SAMN04488694_10850 [Natrinema hispanicum]|uniref:Core-binding (CB) domain-containing protein n=1 Tax=Natrinema hispanicum TaxID=392421 RepID=A0A1I0FB19_9EURY|nr:hypothetical protein SAMN04488694_10850 [Natrinema hispanicum]
MASAANKTTKITTYLDHLSGTVPASTYHSHKRDLTVYRCWCEKHGIAPEHARDEQVACFVEDCLISSNHSVDTVYGRLCTVANYLAVATGDDPELVKVQIASELNMGAAPEVDTLKNRIWHPINEGRCLDETTRETVEALFDHLRQRRFGSRTHVFAEILADTMSPVGPVQRINLSNIDLDKSVVEVELSDQFLASQAGLVTERSVEISATTSEPLKIYLDYERKASHENGRRPLFTSSRGRSSSCTLRRSVKKESETAITYSPHSANVQQESSGDQNRSPEHYSVTPSDIRWCAIADLVN